MKKILIATNNQGKVREFRKLLEEFEVYSLSDLAIDIDVDETGLTYEDNAILKVEALRNYQDEYLIVADDSGIEISFFDNKPGVYSARFLSDLDYPAKNIEITNRMKDVSNRYATFQCRIALLAESDIEVFSGVLEGEIADTPHGTEGFGYDPIFYISEYKQTLSELGPDFKNTISHRYKAICELKEYLNKRYL